MDHHNIASTLSWHGLRAESAYVLRMGEQRAELLEALKEISGIACMNFQEDSDIHDIYEISSAAITKTEAAE